MYCHLNVCLCDLCLYADNMTKCEKHSEVMNHIMAILGKFQMQPPEILIPLVTLLTNSSITKLKVPSCWDQETAYPGQYKYICTYDVNTLRQEGCSCVGADGTLDTVGQSLNEYTECRSMSLLHTVCL